MSANKVRKDVFMLILKLEREVITLLKSKGWIGKGPATFLTAKLTPEGKALIGMSDLLITADWIREWQLKWPSGLRGSSSVIRGKLERFMMTEKTNLKQIEEATERWLELHQSPYCGNANHFFYKKIEGKEEISRCNEMIEALSLEQEEQQKFGGERVFGGDLIDD